MKANKIFSLKNISILMAMCCLAFVNTESFAASPRTGVRGTPSATTARKSAQKPVTENTVVKEVVVEKEVIVEKVKEVEPEPEEPIYIENKSSQFGDVFSSVSEGADDNAFAEQIRKQRNSFDISESSRMVNEQQQSALASGRNACDVGLRECMAAKCGNDFTKCALDGDTIFGDKLNSCRLKLTCTGEEFRLFTTEIREDRDLNVKLSSYTKVIECGNNYNKCLVDECGNTYSKCLGKNAANRAVDKCSKIAKQCTEQDSGLASRFDTVIGKLRESAEKDVKVDEERMYTIRDSMRSVCSLMGAMFDERSFDCVYTVNFFAGDDQSTPTASRKRYAGDTFVCLQEWFGINATTFKENAFRETRSQTAASSAMLGSGVGMAAGLVSSGAIDRAKQTQDAKKELKTAQKAEVKAQRKEDRKENKAMRKARRKEDDAVVAKGAEVAASATHEAIYEGGGNRSRFRHVCWWWNKNRGNQSNCGRSHY